MPDALAEPLSERLLRSFPPNQDYARADWADDSIPGPVQHYLDHLLRHRSRREARRLRRARTDWVNYDHPDVEDAVRTFFTAVEHHARVPEREWADTIRTAAHRTTDHLVQPIPTLRSFIFDQNAESVSASEIQWRMRFFGPYSYLREAAQAVATKRDRDALGPDEFERSLRRVDEQMTADFDPERWGHLLEPLFETAEYATGKKEVSVSLLSTFFDEKNATSILKRLRTYQRENGSSSVDPTTLSNLLDSTEATDESEPSGEETESSVSEFYATESSKNDLEDIAESTRTPGSGTDSSKTEVQEPTPLWKRFKQGRPRRKKETDQSTDEDSQPLWTQFQQTGTPSRSTLTSGTEQGDASSDADAETEPVPTDVDRDLVALERDVLGTPNPSHRKEYVRKLFKGDTAAYRRILERLQATESWSRASQIIAGDVFRANKVNIYSDAAVHFTNAVEATFQE